MPKPTFNVLRSRAWQVSLGRLLLLFAIALIVGLASGQVVPALLAMFAGYSLWSLYSLLRVQRWLLSRSRLPPPSDMGVWSDVAEFIYRRHQGSRNRQRRLVRLLRAYREARDPDRWNAGLARVAEAWHGGQNMVPVIMNALRCQATMGEIHEAMRQAQGWSFR